MGKAQRNLREDQLYRAAFTAKLKDRRRRSRIRQMLNAHRWHPAVAYYLALGQVPQGLWEQG